MYWQGSHDIKELLGRVLLERAPQFRGKVVIDVPAGNGVTSRQLKEWGADVRALDLFPEFFREPGLECAKVDLTDALPLPTASADWIIFQEGIEHLPDQVRVLRECARVLRPDGKMILTTPNTSNLRSKLAHFLAESETLKVLPPNEVDSVWATADDTNPDAPPRVYFGHLFSIGIQRLRTLAKVAGLEIVTIHPARVNWTSFALWCVLAPWIHARSAATFRRSLRKNGFATPPPAYTEAFALMRSRDILCCGHLIVEFRKSATATLPTDARSARDLRDVIT
jgi:SAM-dependent methyltransferase